MVERISAWTVTHFQAIGVIFSSQANHVLELLDLKLSLTFLREALVCWALYDKIGYPSSWECTNVLLTFQKAKKKKWKNFLILCWFTRRCVQKKKKWNFRQKLRRRISILANMRVTKSREEKIKQWLCGKSTSIYAVCLKRKLVPNIVNNLIGLNRWCYSLTRHKNVV